MFKTISSFAGTCAACALVLLPGSPLGAQSTAFTGATVWDGTGAPSQRGMTLVVEDGRVVSLEPDGRVPPGAGTVELDGRFVIPGLIDTHAHVSGRWAPADVTGEEARIRGDLALFAAYGVTTVNSLGDGPAAIAVREGRTTDAAYARLLAAGPVIAETSAAEARSAALANADAGVDWLKLRVDDNLGTGTKMPWEAVQAVLDVGEERGVPVATHLFYQEDALRLIEMGTGMIAHSIRDTGVSEELIEKLLAAGICYVPTLTREVSTFIYANRPGFFDEDFFLEYADEAEVARLSEPASMAGFAESPAAAGYRVALRQALENLPPLIAAGVPIAFGTDAGPAARFPGYFQHMELALMVGAGLTPEQALTSATRTAASCLGRNDIGTLEPGRWADFLVLTGDPLRDITNSKTLEQVYLAGQPVRQTGPGGPSD